MAFARPSETYTRWPSGESTAPIGRGAVGPLVVGMTIDVATVCVAVSITLIVAAVSAVTKAVAPSCVKATDRGRAAVFISHIAGSYSGIMGLPLYETWELLAPVLGLTTVEPRA